MTYRLVCTFHPEIAVFPYPRKGAWRVRDCYLANSVTLRSPTRVIHNRRSKLLIVNSLRSRQRHSWISPLKVLKEWLAAYGREAQDVAGHHAYNPGLWTDQPCERGPQVRPWA